MQLNFKQLLRRGDNVSSLVTDASEILFNLSNLSRMWN